MSQRRLVPIARWFVLCAQSSEKVPDLQVLRREDGGLTPACCSRTVQTSVRTFAGSGHHRRNSQGNKNQPGNHRLQVEPVINAILEISQISLRVLRSNEVIGASRGTLQIAQNSIHPIEFWLLHRGSPTITDDLVMQTSKLGYGITMTQNH